MTSTDQFISKRFQFEDFIKPILLGAGIALCLICLFLFSDPKPSPAWGPFYMIRPLIIVPFAGAAGGAFFAFMQTFEKRNIWLKITAAFISLIVYVFCIWIGSVIGLAGTYWN